MAVAPLSIKLKCASWQQLATIYKRDLSKGTLFLRAANPPPLGTEVKVDLTLPSQSVIGLVGTVAQHVDDPQRGAGVELKLQPIPPAQVWMIESALSSENKSRAPTVATPPHGVPAISIPPAPTTPSVAATPATGVPIAPLPKAESARHSGPLGSLSDGEDVAGAERELIRALQAEAESLKKLNPFLVLGVGYETNDGDVRAAFGDLTKRYHPDRFARYQSPELRSVAAEIFILIRDAYRRLGDETSRAQVLGSLGRSPAPRAVPRPQTSPVGVAVVPPPPPSRPGTPPPRPATPPPVPRMHPRGETAVEAVPPPPPPPLTTDRAERGVPPKRAQTEPAAPPSHDPHEPAPSARQAGQGPITVTSSPAPTAPLPPEPKPPMIGTPMRAPTPRPEARPDTRPDTRMDSKAPTEPPPPMQTDRRPVLVSPSALADSNDPSAIDALLDAGKFDEAVGAYKLLAKKNPNDRTVRAGMELCEGLRALSTRDRLEAAQRFEAALEIDPSNERAARELADMRRQATNERKGLLSRLMGKKE